MSTLAVLKVHSSHLSRCNKYFETYLSERWRDQPSAASSQVEHGFSLEINADVACYTDCFSRMYSSFHKDFRDVEYSLELLKSCLAAEYHKLMDSISRYLSAIPWTGEDERRIREYSSSPDFSRNQGEDLVTRLGLHVSEEERRKKMCDMIHDSMISALGGWESQNYRNFIEELLEGIQIGTNFVETVIEIIIDVGEDRLIDLENKCLDVDRFSQVGYLAEDASELCWILRLLLSKGLAEDLVQCLLSLKRFLSI